MTQQEVADEAGIHRTLLADYEREGAPDRLEEIAESRGFDPDVRWLLDEVLRLRGLADAEHAVVLDLAQVAIQRLLAITSEVAAIIDLLGSRR